MAKGTYWDNPWAGFLEESPQALYRAILGTTGSMNFMDYWKSKYADVYGNYWGQLGKQALGGNAPSMSFYDYLLNQNNFINQWKALAPQQRGEMSPSRVSWNIPRP